jgi:hypothetical protein
VFGVDDVWKVLRVADGFFEVGFVPDSAVDGLQCRACPRGLAFSRDDGGGRAVRTDRHQDTYSPFSELLNILVLYVVSLHMYSIQTVQVYIFSDVTNKSQNAPHQKNHRCQATKTILQNSFDHVSKSISYVVRLHHSSQNVVFSCIATTAGSSTRAAGPSCHVRHIQ